MIRALLILVGLVCTMFTLTGCPPDTGPIPCDLDDDGFLSDGDDASGNACGGDDCNDGDDNVFPGAGEMCNGIDDDCDGMVPLDEDDNDGDGFFACEDCNDANPLVHTFDPKLGCI